MTKLDFMKQVEPKSGARISAQRSKDDLSDLEVYSVDVLYEEGEFDSNYIAKSKILSDAIDELGFGKYQWGVFIVSGFGWFSDNAWPVATGLILQRLNEVDGVHFPDGRAPYLTLAQNLGLLVGVLFWSLSSDLIGRRVAFNLTLLITGIFSVVAGASPNFAAIATFDALWSFGVGGNIPVDSAVFLESIPTDKKWLLTVLSIYWAFGQLVTNLISWGLISNYSCDDQASVCYKRNNKGWRYFLFTLGGLTMVFFIIRFAIPVYESPRFYLARGQDEKAVHVVHKIAKINGKECHLTVEQLRKFDDSNDDNSLENNQIKKPSTAIVKEKLSKFNLDHLRLCFSTRKLATSFILVVISWALIGLAFPLYNAFLPTYLEKNGNANEPLSVSKTYRNALIVSVMGIPGSIIAGLLVELRIGRKGTLCISLLLTGVFLFCSTTAKTSNANLAWNCMFSLFSNMMYGVLYAYTPEIFPAKVRGTALGIASAANRVFGIFAPVIAMLANLDNSAPIYVSGALFIFVGILTVFFPYEPNGRASL